MSEVLSRLCEAANPDYKVTEIENVLPFEVAAEIIGASAGRLYLRERNKVTAVTTSIVGLLEIIDAIQKAIEKGEAE